MTKQTTDAILRKYPGVSSSFERFAPDEMTDELEILDLALDALEELSTDRFEPLGVELSVACLDIETDYPTYQVQPKIPGWYLESEGQPQHVAVEEMLNDFEKRTVGHIDNITIRRMAADALQQQPPSKGLGITWIELAVRAIRMKLPDTQSFADRDAFILDINGFPYKIPLERNEKGVWISGPIQYYETEPPILVRIQHEVGVLQLQVGMHWSYWANPGQPGRDSLEAGFRTLIESGWSPSQ